MTTTGTARPAALSHSRSSSPLIPGRWRSRTRQAGAGAAAHRKNSSAVAYAATARPADRIRRPRALRTDSSSSMMAMVWQVRDMAFPRWRWPHRQAPMAVPSNCTETGGPGQLDLGPIPTGRVERVRLRRGVEAQFAGHADQLRQRVGAHLAHDAGAVDLDGLLGHPQAVAHLLVEQALDDQGHDFALARAERGGPFPVARQL